MSKILILTPQLPYPPEQGTSLRNYQIIRGLSERHEITLLSFLEAQQTCDPDIIQPLLEVCARTEMVLVPQRSQLRRLWQLIGTRRPDMAHRLFSPPFNDSLRRLLHQNQFDLVQIEGLELARAMEIIRESCQTCRILFDNHNAETELQRRAYRTDLADPRRWLAALYSWFQMRRLHRFESWACEQADAVTVVSTADQQLLRSMQAVSGSGVTVIPNCIDWEAYQPPALPSVSDWPGYDLVFSGKMDYRPNIDAVLWFADHVWPIIIRERPHTTWAIVGQKPHGRLARLRQITGITLTGRVESVQPFLFGAGVYIMPFRLGSGTRLKLIEAMAAGKAIVSTQIGAEGYGVQHGRELFIADSSAAFAQAVLKLLESTALREELGQTARSFARHYDWRRIVPLFDDVYHRLLRL